MPVEWVCRLNWPSHNSPISLPSALFLVLSMGFSFFLFPSALPTAWLSTCFVLLGAEGTGNGWGQGLGWSVKWTAHDDGMVLIPLFCAAVAKSFIIRSNAMLKKGLPSRKRYPLRMFDQIVDL